MIHELNRIFRDIFDDPALTITPATSAADIAGWDSVAQVKLVLAIEEEFGVEFNIDEVAAFRTVADFEHVIVARHVAG
jgi:acyl carrier protein